MLGVVPLVTMQRHGYTILATTNSVHAQIFVLDLHQKVRAARRHQVELGVRVLASILFISVERQWVLLFAAAENVQAQWRVSRLDQECAWERRLQQDPLSGGACVCLGVSRGAQQLACATVLQATVGHNKQVLVTDFEQEFLLWVRLGRAESNRLWVWVRVVCLVWMGVMGLWVVVSATAAATAATDSHDRVRVENEEAPAVAIGHVVAGNSRAVAVEAHADLRVVVLAQKDSHVSHLDDELAVVTTTSEGELSSLDSKELAIGNALERNNWSVSVAPFAVDLELSILAESAVGRDAASVAEADGLGRGLVDDEHDLAFELLHRAQGKRLDLWGEDKLCHVVE